MQGGRAPGWLAGAARWLRRGHAGFGWEPLIQICQLPREQKRGEVRTGTAKAKDRNPPGTQPAGCMMMTIYPLKRFRLAKKLQQQ